MRRLSVLLTAAAMLAFPVLAADPPPADTPLESTPQYPPQTPGEQAKQGVELLMKALEGWVRQLPTYAPPEVTPEGDIIIRRLDRKRSVPGGPADQGSKPPGSPTQL